MLSEYLELAARAPWRWGHMDCCAFAGDWIAQATGKDPYRAVRGAYGTATEAKRLIVNAGGFVPLVTSYMAAFETAQHPECGDIGLIETPMNDGLGIAGHALVIRLGNWWIGRSESGIAGVDAEHKIAWRIA